MNGKFLFGMIRVFVPGCLEDVLNCCHHSSLELYQIEQKESGVEFYCPFDQKNKVFRCFQDAKIVKITGVCGFLVRQLKCPFHLFLLVWVVVLYVFLSHTIFHIEYQATSESLKQNIEIFLDQQDVRPGQIIVDASFEQTLKENLKKQFVHELSWIDVTRHASLLTIRFNHKETVVFDSLSSEPLISTKHAVVTRFEVLHGLKTVQLNQVVAPGDVLVQPYLIDSKGQFVSLCVSGQVYGKTWYTMTSELDKNSMNVFDFFRLLYECRRQIEKEIDEDEKVLKENILQLHESEGKIGITVHYTCMENITKQ